MLSTILRFRFAISVPFMELCPVSCCLICLVYLIVRSVGLGEKFGGLMRRPHPETLTVYPSLCKSSCCHIFFPFYATCCFTIVVSLGLLFPFSLGAFVALGCGRVDDILFISHDTFSDSIAKLFRACFPGVSHKYRAICCKTGYRTDMFV